MIQTKSVSLPKRSSLMIAVLPDEVSAFEAYRLLQFHGISPENLALVGKGYSAPESVGLADPKVMVQRYGRYGTCLVGLLGLGIGLWWSWFWALPYPLNIGSGLLGAGIGGFLGMGLGTAYGILFKSATAIACHNCLKKGQYLLLLEGDESLTRKGKYVLSTYAHPSDMPF